MTENQRIKEIRLANGLTMEEFGKRIGVNRSTVSRLESGGISVTEKIRLSISREYYVRAEWLRDGTGEMLVEQNVDALLGQFFGEISRDDDGSFRKRLITALAKLGPRDWAAIADFAEKIINARSE